MNPHPLLALAAAGWLLALLFAVLLRLSMRENDHAMDTLTKALIELRKANRGWEHAQMQVRELLKHRLARMAAHQRAQRKGGAR